MRAREKERKTGEGEAKGATEAREKRRGREGMGVGGREGGREVVCERKREL